MVDLMAQSIPSVPIPPGHLSFSFGKAANAPRLGWAFIQKTHSTFEARTSLQKKKDRILVKDLMSNK